MNFNRFSLLVIITFLGYNLGLSQPSSYIPGQVLVSLQPGMQPRLLVRRMEETFSISRVKTQQISMLMNVWLLESDVPYDPKTLDWLRNQSEVNAAQYNYVVENRNTPPDCTLPDDPLFAQQWQYLNTGANGGVPNADFDAELAWNIATGGLTPAGDTIVVAVIDGGIEWSHSDLAPNLWKNRGEIPNDDLDNDNNGFVDDYNGWNVWDDNDNISGLSTGHGTPVGAIVGAKGNNANGVTGINWDVKIMFVAGGGTQANILSAYDYVLQARRRYNTTNGQSGAFVVAVNCSWGTNYGQPSAAPLWCAAFDSLGREGILSISATANIAVDVDQVGDLPTACLSDYLVAVTSLTNADMKAPNAAWGATHIDLGAYGQEIFTAGSNNSYGTFSGTSFAAPQVSGAIGLLYSSPCPNLIALAKTDPAAAALWARSLLLNSVAPNAGLQNITVTGGRLNLYSLLQDYEDQCSPCPPPFALSTDNISTNAALLKWSEIADFQIVNLRWREVGAPAWNLVADVENEYQLESLASCTNYEFSLMADCGGGTLSEWSAAFMFKTDGCCEPPQTVWANWIGNTEATLAWNSITAATGYRIRVRPVGGNWQIYNSNDATFTLQNLLPCTDYEAGVQTRCDTAGTDFSNSIYFKTAGCGSCTDAAYCPAEAENASDEWITSVAIGNWLHNSGAGGGGYQNFAGGAYDAPQLMPLVPVDVTITPGFQSLPYKEYFRVFIDFNMDGDFDDNGELAFNPAWASENAISGLMIPPDYSNPGLTRMRVMMKYKSPGNSPPLSCETFEFGQVEDYCIELMTGAVSSKLNLQKGFRVQVYPQPAQEEVWLELPVVGDGVWDLSVWDMTGRKLLFSASALENGKFRISTVDWLAGIYAVQLQQGERIFIGRVVKVVQNP